MRYLLPIVSLSILVSACTQGANSNALRFKDISNEWPQRHCTDYTKDTTDDRMLTASATGDGRFGFEVCATQAIPEDGEYTGPVAVRVVDMTDNSVLKEEKWDALNKPPHTLMSGGDAIGGERASFTFSDGKRTFQWTANESQMAIASKEKAKVLDYPNCTRISAYADTKGKTGYMFEQCYTALEGAGDALQTAKAAGVIRLTVFPSGKELQVERLDSMDIRNVQFLFDDNKVQFENNGQTREWPLLPRT